MEGHEEESGKRGRAGSWCPPPHSAGSSVATLGPQVKNYDKGHHVLAAKLAHGSGWNSSSPPGTGTALTDGGSPVRGGGWDAVRQGVPGCRGVGRRPGPLLTFDGGESA